MSAAQDQRAVSFFAVALTVLAAMVMSIPVAQAQTFSVIYTFTGAADGANPVAGVTLGGSGTLYGTTEEGGTAGDGVAFALKQRGTGWTLNPLHEFSGSDGARPQGPLAVGPNGALYGTTTAGGEGYGTVFQLQPPATACKTSICYWDESVLHSFTGSSNDGGHPFFGKLVFDQSGNIYGTTAFGGFYGVGTAYELVADSGWTLSILHSFSNVGGSDGYTPVGGLFISGNGEFLAGTTEDGGPASGCSDGCGTVFGINLNNGEWYESLVYPFSPATGYHPNSTPIMDSSGNLYGTTFEGGTGQGTVFELTPVFEGWQFSVLYAFPTCHPYAGVTMDSSGDLYGSCSSGGADGLGMVFKLTNSGGSWTLTDLHDFTGGSDGGNPSGAVVFDSGNLYGTANLGGNLSNCDGGCGTVWTVTGLSDRH
jgi:uncharacterized repeat protein (TIGR03803 family)